VLLTSPAIIELILTKSSTDKIQKPPRSEGMLTMAEDGFFKAVQGITTIEEVLRVIND
jgi:type II secretory ATPase GspE/PulE/Tfp pilus assembly ATPase PilB-like protein